MLQSMIDNPRPTRARSTDVANAIIDGTMPSCCLAKQPSSIPFSPLEMMVRIAQIAEQYLREHAELHHEELSLQVLKSEKERSVPAAISHVTSRLAEMLGAKLIVAGTWSGYTARRVARVRPNTPILAATPNPRTYQRLALVWGVLPVLVEEFQTIDEMIAVIQKTAREAGLVAPDDLMVIIGGVPFGVGSQTNFLKVLCVEDAG
jgi:pyruvate kinase